MNSRRLWLGLVALAVLIGAGVLWQTTRPDERDSAPIESAIRAWTDKHTPNPAPISVVCPDPVEWHVGGTFHCLIRQKQQTLRVTVTMENDAGDVTWVTG